MTDRVFEYITSVEKYVKITFQKDQMRLHVIPLVEPGKYPVKYTEASENFTKCLFSIRLWYDVPTNSLQSCFVANPFFKEVLIMEEPDDEVLNFLASCEDRVDLEEDKISDTETTKYFDLIIIKNC